MTPAEIKERLDAHRDEILRAELAGWLHLGGRLREGWNGKRFMQYRFAAPSKELMALAMTEPQSARLKLIADSAGPFSAETETAFADSKIAFPGEQWTLSELLMLSTNRSFVKSRQFVVPGMNGKGVALFHMSHARASQMKEPGGTKADKEAGNERSDVFGFPSEVLWSDRLDELVTRGLDYARKPLQAAREQFRAEWQAAASSCYAHDKIPINDVTVWDYSRAVAGFFKAAAAKAWIEGALPENAANVRWALIGIGYPGIEFVSTAVRITDALARRDWIDGKLDKFRNLLEFKYPLGTEIYSDENGAVYLVCSSDSVKATVESILDEVTEDTDDMLPAVSYFEEDAEAGLPIAKAVNGLAHALLPDFRRVEAWWAGTEPAVLCPVCQLRPKGNHGAPDERYICHICLDRRQNLRRSRDWLSGSRGETVWIDEVADQHGICALITGRLEIDNWLTESESSSPFRLLPIRPNMAARKEPVFLRVEACWSAAESFWQHAGKECLPKAISSRCILRGTFRGGPPVHAEAYEAILDGDPLSAIWDGTNRAFITAGNLSKFQGKLTNATLHFRRPTGYMNREDAGRYERRADEASKGEVIFHVSSMGDTEDYRPIIPILAEPRHFLAIVPAAEAVKTCESVISAYRDRLGRVSTMLPIALGTVFFDRRTPIYAVLQAGRKMLGLPTRPRAARFAVGGSLETARQGNRLTIAVDTRQDWYFNRVQTGLRESKAVSELIAGDNVTASISHVDFTHLETTGQRYLLAYWDDGQRLDPERPTRAMTLDGFGQLNHLWEKLKAGLTTSQINELFSASEQKRQEWGLGCPTDERPYTGFVRALILQAEWKMRPSPEAAREMAKQIAQGLLRDAIELHMKILKGRGREAQQ